MHWEKVLEKHTSAFEQSENGSNNLKKYPSYVVKKNIIYEIMVL